MSKSRHNQFFNACESGEVHTVASLIPQLPDIDIKTEQGWTGLIMAVYNEHIELAKFLVQNGANVNETNAKGTSVFMYAKTPVFRSKQTDILAWLLSVGADINVKDQFGLTVLDYVNKKAETWLANWLIERGAITAN